MNLSRFDALTAKYAGLRVAVIGDFCLDRYLEVDFSKREVSIETGLPVFNVVQIRPQPGAAGTILTNLSALGVSEIHAVGFAGEDGEGWELARALKQTPGARMEHFFQTAERCTFTYTKPHVLKHEKPPKPFGLPPKGPFAMTGGKANSAPQITELNRLDFKNWTPTPTRVTKRLNDSVRALADKVDAFVLLDQVDVPDTGVLTKELLGVIGKIGAEKPDLLILADGRRGFSGFPPVTFKMNGTELTRSIGNAEPWSLEQIHEQARTLSAKFNHHLFITMAECGIVGASPDGTVAHAPALPVRGEIDIVGAGDAVTANLVASLLAGGNLGECLEIANAAASLVIHQLGTTGTATIKEIRELISQSSS